MNDMEDNIQEWSPSGITYYNFDKIKREEYKNSEFVDTYYILRATLNHDELKSTSKLKYRFTKQKDAEDCYCKVRRQYPDSFVRLTKETTQTIIEYCA